MGEAAGIFTSEFLATPPEEVGRAIARDGFWVFDNALLRDFTAALDDELGNRPLALNVNDVGPVRYHQQTYFTHALAASKGFFDVVTHPKLRAMCRAHLGDQIRLKCQRYYQSGLHYELTWHTDDKTPSGVRTRVAGVGVVMYLQDTFAGELQVLKGSNQWSETVRATEFDDKLIQEYHSAEILSIARPAGALIIFDSHTLHRTRPIATPGFVRKSVFLQVDADISHSEKMIVDTQYVDPKDEELLRYLGFGMPSGYPSMPPSSLSTLTDSDLRGLARNSLKVLASRKTLGPVLGTLRAGWRRLRAWQMAREWRRTRA